MAPERLDPYADPSSIAHSLDFSPGHKIRAKVRHIFSTSVNPISRSHRFFLVVSFGRAVFRLDELNVSIALSSCLGFAVDEIGILHLRDRVFRFEVSCKAVGFFIHNLRWYACQQFICHFHLWGFGGPNWIREEQVYYAELDAEWSSYRGAKQGSRFYNAPINKAFSSHSDRSRLGQSSSSSVLTGSNRVPIGFRFNTQVISPDDHGNHAENRIVFGSFNSGNPGSSNFNLN